ncbi:VWA domain-containing protein [Gilvimarinus polysaccharolyticus]|uniref:VWA domain-containing protein n=1 Tax=Gilvimarinus polysaccharolyticus TaxID=863921 RepID=UPI000673BF23|nr:vWA domain-containing protein [Gilvimarinus polysaccharolyticus]
MLNNHLTYRSTLWVRISCVLICTLLVLSAYAAETNDDASTADIRLLIDVSGSMNQSDPQNLRAEGLVLLAKMLPADTRAGVWSFAGNVKEVSVLEPVDNRWRLAAQNTLQELRAVGQLTDIGAALSRVARTPKNAESAHILLLTDGKVDVHADAERNVRERTSILTELLPNLIARGFVIHTVALSNDADAELLQAIAVASAGEHRVVTNRDELVSVFVDILDQAVPPQRLPMSGDGFSVDASVNELTVLIYHADANAVRPHLLDPDLLPVSAKQLPTNVRWLSRPRYDLVTITQPKKGRWQLVNDATDARLTILTDLTLQVQPHAKSLLSGEPLSLSFVLRERGQVLTEGELLQNIRADLNVSAYQDDGALGAAEAQKITLRPADDSGRFLLHTNAPKKPGQYQLKLRVDGATFAREYQRQLEVEPVFTVELKKHIKESTAETTATSSVVYHIVVTGASTLNAEQTEVVAHIKDSTGANALRALKHLPEGLWGLTVTPEHRGRYVIELQAKGIDNNGREFSQTLAPLYFSYPAEGDPKPVAVDDTLIALEQALTAEREALARERGELTPAPVIEVASSISSSVASIASVTPVPETTKSEGGNSWLIALVVLFNIVLLGSIYWLYRRFSGKSMESDLDVIEQQLRDNEGHEAQVESSEAELPAGAFDDVFADLGEVTPAAPKSTESKSESEASEMSDMIQLDDDDMLAALGDLVDFDTPDPEADDLDASDANSNDKDRE